MDLGVLEFDKLNIKIKMILSDKIKQSVFEGTKFVENSSELPKLFQGLTKNEIFEIKQAFEEIFSKVRTPIQLI